MKQAVKCASLVDHFITIVLFCFVLDCTLPLPHLIKLIIVYILCCVLFIEFLSLPIHEHVLYCKLEE